MSPTSPVNPVTDEALIRRTLDHDDRFAFGELVKRHQSAVRYSLRQWTRWDEALADDLAQEVFLKAYRKLSQFRRSARFSTWLYRIAYTSWLNHRAGQRSTEGLTQRLERLSGDDAKLANLHLDLENALARLTADQRIAVHLCLQKGFSHSEAARVMEIPLGTVKTHISRGKDRLRQYLAAYEEVGNG